MNPFFVFGMINLIMAIVTYPLLKKEVTNPNCADDVKSVKTNKVGITIYFSISFIITLIGIILFFV